MGNPFGAENELLISKVKTLLITGKGPPLKEKIYLSLLLGVQDRESSHGCFPSRFSIVTVHHFEVNVWQCMSVGTGQAVTRVSSIRIFSFIYIQLAKVLCLYLINKQCIYIKAKN